MLFDDPLGLLRPRTHTARYGLGQLFFDLSDSGLRIAPIVLRPAGSALLIHSPILTRSVGLLGFLLMRGEVGIANNLPNFFSGELSVIHCFLHQGVNCCQHVNKAVALREQALLLPPQMF